MRQPMPEVLWKAKAKRERLKREDYWHRRWAGDALKGMLASGYSGSGKKFASLSLTFADDMQQAYKDRDDAGQQSGAVSGPGPGLL